MLDRTAENWREWLSEFSKGDQTEAWRGIMCFLRWIQIRALNGHAIPNFLPGIEGDLYHSELLRRLLAGREPLVHPPPESFGQAWYDLIETGHADNVEVKPWEWAPDVKIAINRGIWTIVEKRSETELLVTFRQGGQVFRLSHEPDGSWRLSNAGEKGDIQH